MSQLNEIGIVDNCTPQERRSGKNFLREARHIAALVERHIPRLKTPNFWKILVICGTEDTRTHLKVIGGVLDVCVPCDLVNYYSGDSIAKKEFVLDALSKGLSIVTTHTGIGKHEFPEAILKSAHLVNQYAFPQKPRSSPNRKWKAYLWCTHEADHFTADLVVMNRDLVEMARSFVFKASPSEFDFVRQMDVPCWNSNEEIEVDGKIWLWDAEKKKLKMQNAD